MTSSGSASTGWAVAAWLTLGRLRAVWAIVMALLVPFCSYGYVKALRDPRLLDQPEIVRTVESFGIPVQVVMVVALVVPWILGVALSIYVFVRQKGSRAVVVQTIALVLMLAYAGRSLVALEAAHPWLSPVTTLVTVLAGLAWVHFLLTFPTATFEPPWSAVLWAAAAAVLMVEPNTMTALMRMTENEPPRGSLVIFVITMTLIMLASVGVQGYRYRRLHGWVERQQLRWAMFPLLLFAIYVFALIVMPTLIFDVSERWVAVAVVSATPLGVLVPVGMVLAILKYRLYDVDVLINRTLVYGALTGVVAAGYLGLVTLLQSALQRFTPQTDIAVAASTLVVAALFRPLRSRLQTIIDRQFYRSKYDATATLQRFSARLRDQVDLESLSREIVAVVEATMQPTHAQLWLRRSSGSSDHRSHMGT